MTRNSDIGAQIYAALRNRPNELVTHSELMKELGCPSSSLSGAGQRLAAREGSGVEKLGSAYVYRPGLNGRRRGGSAGPVPPPPLPVGTLLEVVGRSEAGRTIVRVESGTCYVLGDVL